MRINRVYPKGTTFTQWNLQVQKGGKPRIRREATTPDGKKFQETHPLKKFIHIIDEPTELADFVIRLNGKDPRIERIKDRLEFEHAFIGKEFLNEYETVYLRSFIPSEVEAKKLVGYLKCYALNWFVGRMALANPLQWKQNESRWGLALINKPAKGDPLVFDDKEIRSGKVLKLITYELNRFMRFLHSKHADVPPIVFEPLSKAILREHEARREMDGDVRESLYIPDHDWLTIRSNCPTEWKPLIEMCYFYGLRKNEAYGLKIQDVKKSHVSIERQLNKLVFEQRTFKPLKGRYQRRTPHWFCTAQEAYKLVEQIESITLHSDTISHLFTDLCHDLSLKPYVVHDLRRTFITNCVKKKITPEDLRLAVGHVDGSTTYKYYVMDQRDLDDEQFKPEKSG